MKHGWTGGSVKCDICTHKWIAVRLIEADQLECPNCENMASFEELEEDEY